MNFGHPGAPLSMTGPGGQDRQGGLAGLARRLFPQRFQTGGAQPPQQMQPPMTGGGLPPQQMPGMATGGGMPPSTLGQLATGGGLPPQHMGGLQTGGPGQMSGQPPQMHTGGGLAPQASAYQPQGRGLLSMWQSGQRNPYGWGYGNER